jgi:CRISPR/Cas system CSM-associated protein Csm3 (group 7 of RAMP superfamily)
MPGTGLKGVVRSRAEFILRSVGSRPEPCPGQQCGKCWTCAVFGYGGGDDESSLTVGARALIRFADAPVLDPELTDKPVRDRYLRVRTHVAIDRFTGGARETALYAMEVLEAGAIPLLVEPLAGLDLLGDDAVREIRAVLRLVLDDLGDGIIGLGAGTARGYGSVTVDFGGSGLPSSDAARRELARMVREGSHVVRK